MNDNVNNSAQFNFIRTYDIAQWIRDLVIENDPKEYLLDFFEPNDEFQEKALKPKKWSILHDFINEKIDLEFEYEARKWPDYDEWNKMTSRFLNLELDFDLFESDSDYRDKIEKRISDEIFPLITEEVFHLLFGDKEFLYHFNSLVGERINTLTKDEYPNLLQEDRVLIRVSYWPKWLQKGIFYRDKGLCSYCYKDVSGLLNISNKIHLDHIVPLKAGGTNDTSNIQLTCEECNLKKGAKNEKSKRFIYKKYY